MIDRVGQVWSFGDDMPEEYDYVLLVVGETSGQHSCLVLRCPDNVRLLGKVLPLADEAFVDERRPPRRVT